MLINWKSRWNNLDKPVLKSRPTEVTYFKLNNELNRPVDGKIPLNKDREAVRAYFLEHVNPNTVFFYSLEEKINYLVDNDFNEREFIEKYPMEIIKELISST